jgi:hypothetical protein
MNSENLKMRVKRRVQSLVMFTLSRISSHICCLNAQHVNVIFMVCDVYCALVQVIQRYYTNIFVLTASEFNDQKLKGKLMDMTEVCKQKL